MKLLKHESLKIVENMFEDDIKISSSIFSTPKILITEEEVVSYMHIPQYAIYVSVAIGGIYIITESIIF